MITALRTMEVPRHVLQTYFRDNAFPLIQHHIDSYNAFLDVDIPTFVRAYNPIVLELDDKEVGPDLRRFVRLYVGGREGTKLRYESPKEEDGSAVTPNMCRLENRTYSVSVYGDLEFEFESSTKKETKTLENVFLGKIPLMLRSNRCYLSGIPGETIGECKYELGGYFVIDGAERVLVTQELLGNNMMSGGRRKAKGHEQELKETDTAKREMALSGQVFRSSISGEDKVELGETETYVSIKTVSEDGVLGPFSHFLVIPPESKSKNGSGPSAGRDRRLPLIQIPGFQDPIPVMSVFRALGFASHRDIYEATLIGVPDKDRIAYDDLFAQLFMSHELLLQSGSSDVSEWERKTKVRKFESELDLLRMYTRNRSTANVMVNLQELLFSNIEGDRDDTGALLRRKGYMLGQMLRMALDIELKRTPPTDRDAMQFKRFSTSGVLCFEEFRRNYREITKRLTQKLDERIFFESKKYAGANISAVIQPENIGYLWGHWILESAFIKSFKGSWGGRLGIGQVLTRPSYFSALYHLRETMLQIDRTISTAPPRRLYGSQFGIMCPIDSPDGSDIGYKKALAIFSKISVATPTSVVRAALVESGLFRGTAQVHPSTWKPEWTKIYLNSDLIGVCTGNTEELHAKLVLARRERKLDPSVSLGWMRIKNEYRIFCDAGRVIRPVYREGVTPDQVMKAKTWEQLSNLLEYIDASETDTHLLSLVPFHPTRMSEIHMTFAMSACANMVPYPDHNPVTRSMFSIAQQKSASSWYNTAYRKRFDTAAMMAVNPQRPVSQTWMYNEVMGRGGCMPYGENAIVAVTVYGGNNQEDSMIVNKASVDRGMWRTNYFHSYSLEEDVVDQNMKINTMIANPLTDETIKRKSDLDYSKLDANGIVRVNSIVDETTVLIGHLSPIYSPTGQVTGYRDKSMEAKRGQTGRVDAVYLYSTSDGRRGVKVRVVEDRPPIIGDKMASRHSQKGTVGLIMTEEDMPFSGSGMRPDLIFNPHGIPTRMTVGQFLEAASNRLGVHLGTFVDATPFTTENRIGELRVAMLKNGFEPSGSEVLYNGQTGEQMEVDIFVGPIYYQRLKQMVEDKINYRATGPKKLLTHQPTQGRSNEGGMRIGEMERDGLISHGMSKFLHESLMDRSDGTKVQFDRERGTFDTSTDTLEVPYSMSLFLRELETLHIVPRIETN
jgi:DNA-directed RNA polymerase II subunit RPB2